MQKKLIYTIMLFFMFSFSTNVMGAEFAVLTEPVYATVIEIIDGDSFIAMTNANEPPIRVRLICVDSEGYDKSVVYLNNLLLGKEVYVYPDDSYENPSERWNLAYITKDGLLVNASVLSTGNGKINPSHIFAREYLTLTISENYASSRRLGIWGGNVTSYAGSNIYSGDGININTASASSLQDRLNISSTIANNIVNYRKDNPFNTIDEIKFVPDFTKALYERNKNIITVVSDINTASRTELLTISSLSSSDVSNIISYRDGNSGFSRISELSSRNIITSSKYEAISNFITVSDDFKINIKVPDEVLDINTATTEKLTKLGISSSKASQILRYRSKYSYKTLGELVKNGIFTTNELNKWEDNLTCNDTGDYININTATRDELLDLGISSTRVSSIVSKQGSITDYQKMPVDLSSYDSKISLYTNINLASEKELLSLSTRMTDDIVSEIIFYRDEQVFGSLSEIEGFFGEMGRKNVYEDIKDFVVVR